MLFSILAIALLDADGWYNSPFIIPVAGCAMIGSIAVAGIWSGVRNREIKSAERLAMIAQGLQPEPEWDQDMLRNAAAQTASSAPKVARPNDGSGARRAGLILSAIGIGLVVFFAFLAIVLNERDVFSGACSGIIPLAIGIGFLIDARHRRRDFDRWMNAFPTQPGPYQPGPYQPGPADASVPPPPPPAPGMTPAQASDWRPLH